MTNRTEIIRVENLYKTYKTGALEVEVLKGISLSVNQGEVVVIKGPSGVGKSTLLHIMGALDVPTAGRVIVDGHDIGQLNNHKLAQFRNKAIGFVFQFHHLLPEFTAYENVILPSFMHESLSEEKQEYARYLLEEVGLSQRLLHKPNELSGGEQQRVAVARALVNRPKVLLADEPTGNLDIRNSEMLYKLLLRLNEKLHQTLVIVTHDEHIAAYAQRVFEMEDGRIVKESTK